MFSDHQENMAKRYYVQIDKAECTCSYSRQTGLLCSHFQAAKLHLLAGPPTYWLGRHDLLYLFPRELIKSFAVDEAMMYEGGPADSARSLD